MELELKDKTALITGAGQGVGRAICHILAAEGARIAVNDLVLEKAERVAGEIREKGGTAIGLAADVVNLEQVKDMVAVIAEKLGPVDILVNNAGVPVEIRSGQVKRTVFAESDQSIWKKQIDLNLHGCLNCVHAVLEPMIERKTGKIISIISEAGRIGEAYMAVYSGAKAGVLGFSKALARRWAGTHQCQLHRHRGHGP